MLRFIAFESISDWTSFQSDFTSDINHFFHDVFIILNLEPTKLNETKKNVDFFSLQFYKIFPFDAM